MTARVDLEPRPVDAQSRELVSDFSDLENAVERHVIVGNQYGQEFAMQTTLPVVRDAFCTLRDAVVARTGLSRLPREVRIDIHQGGRFIAYDPREGDIGRFYYARSKGRLRKKTVLEDEIPELEWLDRPTVVRAAATTLLRVAGI